jgi:hypothetical protein
MAAGSAMRRVLRIRPYLAVFLLHFQVHLGSRIPRQESLDACLRCMHWHPVYLSHRNAGRAVTTYYWCRARFVVGSRGYFLFVERCVQEEETNGVGEGFYCTANLLLRRLCFDRTLRDSPVTRVSDRSRPQEFCLRVRGSRRQGHRTRRPRPLLP